MTLKMSFTIPRREAATGMQSEISVLEQCGCLCIKQDSDLIFVNFKDRADLVDAIKQVRE